MGNREGVSAWPVILHESVDAWLLALAKSDPASAETVTETIDCLVRSGPALGRPLADRVHGSALHNLKELRPPTAGRGAVRILFAFDEDRQALLLVAGDKAGQWNAWYRTAIPLAETRFRQMTEDLKREEPQ